jgi:hypothetical protein
MRSVLDSGFVEGGFPRLLADFEQGTVVSGREYRCYLFVGVADEVLKGIDTAGGSRISVISTRTHALSQSRHLAALKSSLPITP